MVLIRSAMRSDIRELQGISLKLLKEEALYSDFLTDNPDSRKSVKAWTRRMFKNKKCRFFVAEEDSEIVGEIGRAHV